MSLGSFTMDMTRFVEKTKANMGKLIQKVVFDMARQIILRTPVDTGRAKGSWQVSFNSLPADEVRLFDKDGQETIAKAGDVLSGYVDGDTIYIVSNLDYMVFLEYGSSTQAPQGMVRLTVAEFQEHLNKAVRDLK